ncbi:hypothetical protein V6N13_043609 [Hibiscus sabdariffa]|uniref:Protein kinase domain-containing protein n=1 Tax=Hibiscus sabdariffa TaxID=183260 RepID=A0ABR2RG17_9ROSI
MFVRSNLSQSHYHASLDSRMKTAMDIANAVAYLHIALSRPVINRCLFAYTDKEHMGHGDRNVEELKAGFRELLANYVENNLLTEIVDQNIPSEGIGSDELETFAKIERKKIKKIFQGNLITIVDEFLRFMRFHCANVSILCGGDLGSCSPIDE